MSQDNEERALCIWLDKYHASRPTFPRGVPSQQIDGAPGDEYAVMPEWQRIVAVRRRGRWAGWTEVRSIPGLACGRDSGDGMGCADHNCSVCPDNVEAARARGFAFVDGGWS